MSSPVIGATAETTIREAAKQMRAQNIGSLPVFRNDRSIGILSLGDIAEHASEELAGQALGEVSEARARHA